MRIYIFFMGEQTKYENRRKHYRSFQNNMSVLKCDLQIYPGSVCKAQYQVHSGSHRKLRSPFKILAPHTLSRSLGVEIYHRTLVSPFTSQCCKGVKWISDFSWTYGNYSQCFFCGKLKEQVIRLQVSSYGALLVLQNYTHCHNRVNFLNGTGAQQRL